ncbi:hypothetical protein ES707_14223 [subsurface metagenome]
MPRASFKITGEIDDFSRVDNLHTSMRREGAKLLKKWIIEVEVLFSEDETGVITVKEDVV